VRSHQARESRPCLQAFYAARSLPAGVLGPVARRELRRLAPAFNMTGTVLSPFRALLLISARKRDNGSRLVLL